MPQLAPDLQSILDDAPSLAPDLQAILDQDGRSPPLGSTPSLPGGFIDSFAPKPEPPSRPYTNREIREQFVIPAMKKAAAGRSATIDRNFVHEAAVGALWGVGASGVEFTGEMLQMAGDLSGIAWAREAASYLRAYGAVGTMELPPSGAGSEGAGGFARDLIGGAARTAPQFTSQIAATVGATMLGVPPVIAFSLLGVGPEASSQYIQSKEKYIGEGMDEDDAIRKAGKDAAISGGWTYITNRYLGGTVINKLTKPAIKKAKSIVSEWAGRLIVGFFGEATQELSDKLLSDVSIALVNDDQEMLDYMKTPAYRREGALEFGIGGLLGSTASVAVPHRPGTPPAPDEVQGPQELQGPRERQGPIEAYGPPISVEEVEGVPPAPTPTLEAEAAGKAGGEAPDAVAETTPAAEPAGEAHGRMHKAMRDAGAETTAQDALVRVGKNAAFEDPELGPILDEAGNIVGATHISEFAVADIILAYETQGRTAGKRVLDAVVADLFKTEAGADLQATEDIASKFPDRIKAFAEELDLRITNFVEKRARDKAAKPTVEAPAPTPPSETLPDYASMTFGELRKEAKKRGLLTTGKRAELEARLKEPATKPKAKKKAPIDERGMALHPNVTAMSDEDIARATGLPMYDPNYKPPFPDDVAVVDVRRPIPANVEPGTLLQGIRRDFPKGTKFAMSIRPPVGPQQEGLVRGTPNEVGEIIASTPEDKTFLRTGLFVDADKGGDVPGALERIAKEREIKAEEFDVKPELEAGSPSLPPAPAGETLETKGKRGPSRRGLVSLEPLVATVKAGLAAGKWTVKHTAAAARWLRQFTVDTFAAARQILTDTFGPGIGKHVGKIWAALKKEFKPSQYLSKEVMESDQPAARTTLEAMVEAMSQSKTIQEDYEAFQEKKRSKQTRIIKRIESEAVAEGTDWQVMVKMAMKQLEGRIPKNNVEALANFLTEEQIQEIGWHWIRHEHAKQMSSQQRITITMDLMRLLRKGEVPFPNVIAHLERAFGAAFAKKLRSHTMKPDVAWQQAVLRSASSFKTLKAAWDLSATFRQGNKLFRRYPIIGGIQPLIHELGAAVPFVFGERYAMAVDKRLKTGQWANLRRNSRLYLASHHGSALNEREEMMMGRLFENTPILRHLHKVMGVRWSERTFITFLNVQRVAIFDKWAKKIWANKNMTAAEKKDAYMKLARFVNAATGRSNWSMGDFDVFANSFFFAPKYALSQIEYPIATAKLMNTKGLRWVGASQMVADVLWYAGLLAIFRVMAEWFDWEAEFDYHIMSPTFGRIRVGKTTIDMFGGWGSTARMIAQASWGRKFDLDKKEMVKASSEMTFAFWLKGKESPLPSVYLRIREGKQWDKTPYDFGDPWYDPREISGKFVGQLAMDLAVPISIETALEVYEEYEWSAMELMIPEVMGAGVQVYNPPDRKKKYKYTAPRTRRSGRPSRRP